MSSQEVQESMRPHWKRNSKFHEMEDNFGIQLHSETVVLSQIWASSKKISGKIASLLRTRGVVRGAALSS